MAANTFLVVSPCLNGGAYIDETILSVVTQKGDFTIRYHVQDGGSADDTVARLEAWARRLAGGHFPIQCRGVTFSFNSAPDTGMYDAINRAFARLGGGPGDWMTWINASDRLMPGALQTMASVTAAFPDITWAGGRVARIDEAGCLVRIEDLVGYPQRAIAATLNDNRRFNTVQQEGTFWEWSLWHRAGGWVNDNMRLAGDYDLWRRLAGHAELTIIDTVLGTFRRHADRITDFNRYLAEIDDHMYEAALDIRNDTWDLYRSLIEPEIDSEGLRRHGFAGPVVWYDETGQRWCRRMAFPFPSAGPR